MYSSPGLCYNGHIELNKHHMNDLKRQLEEIGFKFLDELEMGRWPSSHTLEWKS